MLHVASGALSRPTTTHRYSKRAAAVGLTPLVIWLLSVKHYPRSLDPEGVTLKSGQRLPWKDLTQKRRLVVQTRSGRKTVTGVGLVFGKTQVKIAPRVLVDGARVLPYLSRVLGEDLTTP